MRPLPRQPEQATDVAQAQPNLAQREGCSPCGCLRFHRDRIGLRAFLQGSPERALRGAGQLNVCFERRLRGLCGWNEERERLANAVLRLFDRAPLRVAARHCRNGGKPPSRLRWLDVNRSWGMCRRAASSS